MKDYTQNSLAFGRDKIDGLEVGEAMIPVRQYEYQNEEGEDKVVFVHGTILKISDEGSNQVIIFSEKDSSKASLLYANGAEKCFKDWIAAMGGFDAESLIEDFNISPAFLKFAKQVDNNVGFSVLFEVKK